jgi:hypothetical protein
MKIFSLFLIALFCLSLSSCQTYMHAVELELTQPQAGGIMSVQATPPSTGYRRLQAYAGLNEAIRFFIQAKGYPEYYIEKRQFSKVAMVCFYPKKNQAYMVQSIGYTPQNTRILGPEPIGEKDKRLFKAIREVENAALAYEQ